MIIDLDSVLKRNYQRMSTNRFIVDSPRFWRKEFHPRFKDLFEFQEFTDIITAAAANLSYELKPQFVAAVSIKIWEWFSGYRFIEIPAKNPQAAQMFLSDLYFTLLDILPQISMTDYPLTQDDFNVVGHKAESGKNDTSKVATAEHNKQANADETRLDILSSGTVRQESNATTENVDEETEQNTTQVNDVFLSPQNTGVRPVSENLKHKGVEGVDTATGGSFTTNTANTNMGESIKNKSNATTQAQTAINELQQDNDTFTKHATDGEQGMKQEQENTTAKNDNYIEQLHFNRAEKLQEYYNLNKDNLWREILSKLSRWILQVDIATGDSNYIDCQTYE